MAKKKHRKKRKGHRNLSAGAYNLSKRGKKGKRKGRRKKRGFLSEMGIGADLQPITSGGAGGFGAGLLNDMIPDDYHFLTRTAINLGSAYVAHKYGKMPNVAAGIAGAWGLLAYQKMKSGSLQEDADYADEDAMSEMPMFCDEAGNPMALAEDGQLYYLDEDGNMVDPAGELSAGDYSLSASGDNMYPSYINPSDY